MVGFITDAQLTASVQPVLKLAPSEQPGAWLPQAVTDANAAAWADIQAALGQRGYLVADVMKWAAGPAWQTRLGLCTFIITTGALTPLDASIAGMAKEVLCLRDQLASVVLTDVNGALILPSGPPAMPVSTGDMLSRQEAANRGRFRYSDGTFRPT